MSKPIHTPGFLAVKGEEQNMLYSTTQGGGRVANVFPGQFLGKKPSAMRTANARLLAAAYNAFDCAAKKLGVNAVELAESMANGGLEDLVKALRPFAEAVFNDNGDLSVNTGHITNADYLAARTAIAKVKGGVSDRQGPRAV